MFLFHDNVSVCLLTDDDYLFCNMDSSSGSSDGIQVIAISNLNHRY